MKAGETLRIVVAGGRIEWTGALPPRASGAEAAPAPIRRMKRRVRSRRAQSPSNPRLEGRPAENASSRGPTPPPQQSPDWRESICSRSLRARVRRGRNQWVQAGVQRSFRRPSSWRVEDGARLVRTAADRANEALRLPCVRGIPSDPRRAAAAFALGKVAFDEARDYRQAAEWFSISIREQPRGSLSREAAETLARGFAEGR